MQLLPAIAAAFPIGYVPDIAESGGPWEPGAPPFVWPEEGVIPSDPISGGGPYHPPITSTGSTAAEEAGATVGEAAEGAEAGALTGAGEVTTGAVLGAVGIAIGVFAVGYWIGCGGEFC